jgi:hypothetical protein
MTFEITKKEVQEKMKSLLGLNVDQVRPGGAGNSNTGNVARKAFQNPKQFAAATGVDEDLINRFRVILISISCQFPLDPEKLKHYCLETASLFKTIYPWFNIPVTVHKVLFHAATIMSHSILPLGKN